MEGKVAVSVFRKISVKSPMCPEKGEFRYPIGGNTYSGREIFIYCDPPYPHEKRKSKHRYDFEDPSPSLSDTTRHERRKDPPLAKLRIFLKNESFKKNRNDCKRM
jgi:hypothetical protein